MSTALNTKFIEAIDFALRGEWDAAHMIVQDYNIHDACWIHAVLHKIEGDAWNSRYWYARTSKHYEDFSDPQAELRHIKSHLQVD